jgi:hypothetical protein
MYEGVKEALKELSLSFSIYTLKDIPNTFNPKMNIFDFFKIDPTFLQNSLLFDNLPYDKAITIVEYLLKLKNKTTTFALACAGFTANSFLNKYDLLYIYIADAKFVSVDKQERYFPTCILCNDIDSLTSNQRKKQNMLTIEKFKNNKVLSSTDIFTLLKYMDIKKEQIIKLSNDFYGGILISGFSNIDKKRKINKYKGFAGIIEK